MQNETVSRRYATAVFALAKEANDVAGVARDLHAALDAIRSDERISRFFVSPVVDRAQKLKAFGASLLGLREIAQHTVLLLIRKRRETLLAPIVTEYDKLALAERGREPLEIVTARPLAPPELAAMVARLSQTYAKTFEVTHRVEPELLAGIRITMGDRRIDGSVAGRLDDLARTMFTNS